MARLDRLHRSSHVVQGHCPPEPPAIGFEVEPQTSSHVEPDPQVNEHDPVHVMRHFESAPHDTLLLSPTVAVQLALEPHPRLHDAPHVPEHVEDSEQFSEQLLARSQEPNEHDVPDGQLQLVPVHVAGGGPAGGSSLQAAERQTRRIAAMWRTCT